MYTPVLFLAFSSVATDVGYLPSLAREAQLLRSDLELAEQRSQCQVVVRENVTLGGLIDVFQDPRYRGRIAVLHFAGHADAYGLLLEESAGHSLVADAGGFAAFLAGRPELKLVFLNGCATEGHVAGLHDSGVPAVIATTTDLVHDESACRFAARFYRGLAGGATIAEAFAEANAELQMATDGQESETWHLFSVRDEATKWRLPSAQELVRTLTKEQRRTQANRAALGQKVANFWIHGVLDQSLDDFGLLDLDVEIRPDLVEQPFAGTVRMQNPQRIAKLSDLPRLYDEVNGSLLIAGEPGAGKTIALLTLARLLLDRSERDAAAAIPVIFNLSSWRSHKHRSFQQWLIEQFRLHYKIGEKLAAELLEDNLALLVDGLDEVAADQREACVDAVNAFYQERGALAPLVICSRIAEYRALPRKLQLDGAVLLKPLSAEQSRAVVDAAGPRLRPLSAALQRDAQLVEMASSPLMLNIMAVGAERAGRLEPLDEQVSTQLQRSQLFANYVDSMFERKVRTQPQVYDKASTVRLLTWLANNMDRRSLSIFALEGLQSDWLASRSSRRVYSIGIHLVLWLLLFTICLLGYGLAALLAEIMSPNQPYSLGQVIVIGALFGCLWATTALVTGIAANFMSAPKAVLLTVAAVVLLSAFLVSQPLYALIVGAVAGLPAAMAGAKMAERRTIVLADALRWSWRRAAIGLAIGCAAGATITWFVLVVVIRLPKIPLSDLLAVGILMGLIGMLAAALTTDVQIEMRTAPNEGFHRAARNSITVGAAVLLSVLAIGIPVGLADGDLQNGLSLALMLGLPISMSVALWAGGAACLRHVVLRALLVTDHAVPYQLAHFLDEATDRIFLRRVGGSYIFIHRLLLEHFASQLHAERSPESLLDPERTPAVPIQETT